MENSINVERMLDMFVQFVINKSVNFTWKMTSNAIKLQTYDPEACRILETNMLHYVDLNEIKNQDVIL